MTWGRGRAGGSSPWLRRLMTMRSMPMPTPTPGVAGPPTDSTSPSYLPPPHSAFWAPNSSPHTSNTVRT